MVHAAARLKAKRNGNYRHGADVDQSQNASVWAGRSAAKLLTKNEARGWSVATTVAKVRMMRFLLLLGRKARR